MQSRPITIFCMEQPQRPLASSLKTRRDGGFTLVELIIVMILVVTMAALIAPSLSKVFRRRVLDREATQFFALTEYGRDESVSQGVPMVIWVDSATGRYGLKPKSGYSGVSARTIEYPPGAMTFKLDQDRAQSGKVDIIEFAPNGTIERESIDSLKITDQFQASITIAKTDTGWAYQMIRENEPKNFK